MITFLYTLFASHLKKFGAWLFIPISRTVAACYFVFLPRRTTISVHFYRSLFPERSRWYHIWCAWRQYRHFTALFLDRYLLLSSDAISHTTFGWQWIGDRLNKKKGGIILMSHLGNWEIAAHLLKRESSDVNLLLFLGERNKEKIEKIQKDNLADSGIKIFSTGKSDRSPFALIEAHTHLKNGGIVSLTGDRIWNKTQRTVSARFLNKRALLPESPFLLALISRQPLFFLSSFKTRKRHYTISISQPVTIKTSAAVDRDSAVKKAAQQYADFLENSVKEHPLEWFHFERFLID